MSDYSRAEIEDFYYYEAALLDRRDFETWFALMSPNIRYWAPVREDVDAGDEDLNDSERLAHFDENYFVLSLRVKRISGENVHSDSPQARVRHFISNVRILAQDGDTVEVTSNFICFKSRLRDEKYLSGYRNDRLRKTASGWQIEERCIVLDHSVLPSVTVFF